MNDSKHFFGLAIYSFQDLSSRKDSILTVIEGFLKHRHSDSLIINALLGDNSESIRNINLTTFQDEFQRGRVESFQITGKLKQKNKKLFSLNGALSRKFNVSKRPNYLKIKIYINENEPNPLYFIVELGKRLFLNLQSCYGYADIGSTDASHTNLDDEGNQLPTFDLMDINMEQEFETKIKGVYWLNFLTQGHLKQLSKDDMSCLYSSSYRIEPLNSGGFLIWSFMDPYNGPSSNPEYEKLKDSLLQITVQPKEKIRIIKDNPKEKGLRVLRNHVTRFEKEYLDNNYFPPNDVWRPYRFCVQNVVIALIVVRLQVRGNFLEVDVCLTAEVREYDRFSGVKMALLFLFSEAYKCGTDMTIKFTSNVENGKIPKAIIDLASSVGIHLTDISNGWITASEARQLYLILSGFSASMQEYILKLHQQGQIRSEMLCYLVSQSIWNLQEMEVILLSHPFPDRIFKGAHLQENRHLYLWDLHYARAAVFCGMLDFELTQMEHVTVGGKVITDLEDYRLQVDVVFNPDSFCRTYKSEKDFKLTTWFLLEHKMSTRSNLKSPLFALIRPQSVPEIEQSFIDDLKLLNELIVTGKLQTYKSICIVYPRDFEEIQPSLKEELLRFSRDNGIQILLCPETTKSIDIQANRRITMSRLVRQ